MCVFKEDIYRTVICSNPQYVLRVPCAPKSYNFKFPILQTTKILLDTCSGA